MYRLKAKALGEEMRQGQRDVIIRKRRFSREQKCIQGEPWVR